MSCFGGRDEQIYLIEAFVDKLKLAEVKSEDVGDDRVAIKIKFLDFPVFELTQEDFDTVKPAPRAPDGTLRFSMGKSCLFVKRPIDLVRDLRSSRVKVGVYRVGDTYPTAETELNLPGCLCDQVAMSTNDPQHLPEPFEVKGGYHLLDPGKNYAGTLDMVLRLTSFGRSILTHYEYNPNFLLFRNDGHEREFAVKRFLRQHSRRPERGRYEFDEGALPDFFEKTEKSEEQPVPAGKSKKKVKKGKGKKRGKKRGKK